MRHRFFNSISQVRKWILISKSFPWVPSINVKNKIFRKSDLEILVSFWGIY